MLSIVSPELVSSLGQKKNFKNLFEFVEAYEVVCILFLLQFRVSISHHLLGWRRVHSQGERS